ncbi:amidohydrolase family protein [Membranihabitans marinus]|uniref:amidohydrolase family protein n=1 Tax=Membranihabitans marinus TaxID=1227546 RepID=UPI001F256BA0|nr:amidohydrolase family protein [Membranihabitans marinus]
MIRKIITLFLFISIHIIGLSQETFPRNGAADYSSGHVAFVNANIHDSPGHIIEGGSMIIKEGKIVSVGQKLDIPVGAIKVDLKGKHIYSSFIDLYSQYGVPPTPKINNPPTVQMNSLKKGPVGWNQTISPEYAAVNEFTLDEKEAKERRLNGFGSVLSHRIDGVVRGSGFITTLNNTHSQTTVLKPTTSSHLSFRKGSSRQSYPTSQMGMMALIRQLYLDAEWYREYGFKVETNLSLSAWNELQDLPQIFEVSNHQEILRAGRLAREYNKIYIIKCKGDTYKRVDDIADLNMPLIIPVDFPMPYDVEEVMNADLISYRTMKEWEWAPANLAVLESHNIQFAITADGLSNKKDFLPNIRTAIEYGLSPQKALEALTTVPAQLLNVDDQLGALAPGYIANFIITDQDIWNKKAKILENWIQGKYFQINPESSEYQNQSYKLTIGNEDYQLNIHDNGKSADLIDADSMKMKANLQTELNRFDLIYKNQNDEYIRLIGQKSGQQIQGSAIDADGSTQSFTAVLIPSDEKKIEKEDSVSIPELSSMIYPFEAYGSPELPQAQKYLIKNTTVWTNEAKGILKNTDVLIDNGKIAKIGKITKADNAIVIDGQNYHLTPGIIDEHSHIAINNGVNEGSQASTAEVRIGDVINAEDINIYRQLAGGVTTSQLLHGSANPIGGQSALIKLRWGKSAEELKFKGAAPFIKFALGENVKQSNWGDHQTVRFPQTRMGVEQVFEDYFTQAETYLAKKKSGEIYRKDLELECLSEILTGNRFITCHSYVQSEINMLMHVAENHNFRVNTFTHILEGYKVADKMKAHGAAGSTFADWWAYKYEVIDAIPYNAAIMNSVGVNTSINSDDAETARRLNVEAGKMMKYGGMNEEEALKLVTLNPAKMLHIDDRVGSIKVGKDADIVLWSGHPLSYFSRAEKTFIDGCLYFDRTENEDRAQIIRKERAQLIQQMLKAKKSGSRVQPVKEKKPIEYHCDTMETE